MSTAPSAPGPAERITATLRGVASQAAENRPAGIVVSLILALLTDLFARLAELVERIKAGEYQPRPKAPHQPPTRPWQRRKRPENPAGGTRRCLRRAAFSGSRIPRPRTRKLRCCRKPSRTRQQKSPARTADTRGSPRRATGRGPPV